MFSFASDVRVEFVSQTMSLVPTDAGFSIQPTVTIGDCPKLDMIFVPGGGGQIAVMSAPHVFEWLRHHAMSAQYVTSVCSGSLLLGAAGLLKGYRATSHWSVLDHLQTFGAITDPSRIVIDRNRVTGGGVTAGIDFALAMVAKIRGEEEAKAIQLALEYDPQPPFACGHPDMADRETIMAARNILTDLQKKGATPLQ